jgi:hypothetical protein
LYPPVSDIKKASNFLNADIQVTPFMYSEI